MEHSERVLNELQHAAASVNGGGQDLGTWIIVSALYSEIVLAGLLKEEKRKMEKFNDASAEFEAQDFIDFDAQVARVLKHACCLEEQIVEKVRLGINYSNSRQPQ